MKSAEQLAKIFLLWPFGKSVTGQAEVAVMTKEEKAFRTFPVYADLNGVDVAQDLKWMKSLVSQGDTIYLLGHSTVDDPHVYESQTGKTKFDCKILGQVFDWVDFPTDLNVKFKVLACYSGVGKNCAAKAAANSFKEYGYKGVTTFGYLSTVYAYSKSVFRGTHKWAGQNAFDGRLSTQRILVLPD